MTPLQRYLWQVARRAIELTPAQGERARADLFRKVRALMLTNGNPCPTDDDALQAWMERDKDCSWDDIALQPDSTGEPRVDGSGS